uniref:AlNc14C5G690 protein n=1 Tax=Albugo laibachii Nc14 TaxID=890382 RepID=F0W0Q5_9STRA|nr:AlNc14C5G690 [Albugo laibachii Nc14]|eukprot:CCA14629.1 AlNc14C5G690 [Albugo laibachii Nc14]
MNLHQIYQAQDFLAFDSTLRHPRELLFSNRLDLAAQSLLIIFLPYLQHCYYSTRRDSSVYILDWSKLCSNN